MPFQGHSIIYPGALRLGLGWRMRLVGWRDAGATQTGHKHGGLAQINPLKQRVIVVLQQSLRTLHVIEHTCLHKCLHSELRIKISYDWKGMPRGICLLNILGLGVKNVPLLIYWNNLASSEQMDKRSVTQSKKVLTHASHLEKYTHTCMSSILTWSLCVNICVIHSTIQL